MTSNLPEVPKSRMADPFLARIGGLVYRWLGWTCVGETPPYPKYVIIVAPHTSNWDAFYLIPAASQLKLDMNFFGKHTLFHGPLGWFLRSIGGIPLDRSRQQSFVSQAAEWFKAREKLVIGVAPEGTRRWSPGWKTGFYYIALQAGVPVVLAYLDYARKEGGILPEVLFPSGDIDRDFERLREIYSKFTGYRPANAAPIVPLRSAGAGVPGSVTVTESRIGTS